MIVLRYLLALLTPSGRLPRMPYIAMSFVLIFAHAAVWRLLDAREDGDAYGLLGGSLFFIMWMQFCVVSRRMHDVGRTNQMAVGLFMVAFITYLACLDPNLLSKDEEAQEFWGGIITIVAQVARIAWMFIAVELFRQDGESGSNMFGPEFGSAGINAAKVDRAHMALAESYAATNGISRSTPKAAAAPEPAPQQSAPPLRKTPTRIGYPSSVRGADTSMRQPMYPGAPQDFIQR